MLGPRGFIELLLIIWISVRLSVCRLDLKVSCSYQYIHHHFTHSVQKLMAHYLMMIFSTIISLISLIVGQQLALLIEFPIHSSWTFPRNQLVIRKTETNRVCRLRLYHVYIFDNAIESGRCELHKFDLCFFGKLVLSLEVYACLFKIT